MTDIVQLYFMARLAWALMLTKLTRSNPKGSLTREVRSTWQREGFPPWGGGGGARHTKSRPGGLIEP